MLSRNIIRIILYGLGLTSLAALVYIAGPFVDIGGFRPLENTIIRQVIVVLLMAAVAGVAGWEILRRRKRAEQVAEGISSTDKADSDEVVLKERMKDALVTLKKAGGGKANYLYDLPWYLLIGPPGSGKTTALVNSGLKFPLFRGARPSAVAGVGGTRYCDWWFTEDAVLIDTAGRYTTQDSDAKLDQRSWYAFLDTLKKGRPRQPINGVIVAISVADLLTLGSAELTAHAAAIRARLLELHDHLKVDFPVYAMFTKADLISGFSEYFQNLGERGRQQVFGTTFQTDDKTSNLVGEVPKEFDALVKSLNNDMLDRLQEEPDPATRVQLYGFPTQLEALKGPLYDFLNQIFESTRYHANATLRGFYFTSGTQQGTPIDQLIGALEKTFGTVEVPSSAYSGTGRSYFLTDLITKVVIGEAAWVSTDRAAVQRAAIIKACAYAALIALSAGLVSAWYTSYVRNKGLIDHTNAAVAEIIQTNNDIAKATGQAGGPLQQTSIGDSDLSKVGVLLDEIRGLPAGYDSKDEPVPLIETFGLSQHGRLQSAALTAYHTALERTFRPRLIFRLEEQLIAKRSNPAFIYPALKVYMMLGGRHKADPAVISDWVQRDWADNIYKGEGNEPGRKRLARHLQAMLDLDVSGEPLVSLDGKLLEESQRTLAELSIAQRAYELLKSQASASAGPDWILNREGGRDAGLVFEPVGSEGLDAIKVPYFHTYAGFHRAFLGRLNVVADQMDQERWVLGDAGAQPLVKEQYTSLPRDLLRLYTKDFIDAWTNALAKIKLKRFTDDRTFVALTAAASPSSPIKQLLESIRDETAVTRERPGFEAKPAASAPGTDTATVQNDKTPILLQGDAPGAEIEEAFKSFQQVLIGDASGRPIDLLIKNLGDILRDLRTAATSPGDAPQANADLQLQVNTLRNIAPSLPPPFATMFRTAASGFDNDVVNSARNILSQALGEVTQSCKLVVESRYPFMRGADREVGLVDFGKIFGPSGVMDTYFTKYLSKYVTKGARDWTWRPDPVARGMSANTLRSFQRAEEIRDAFFASGGTQPSFTVTVTPPMLTDAGLTAKLDFYGTTIISQAGNSAPTAVQWPGTGSYQLKITLASQDSLQQQPPSPTQGKNPVASTAENVITLFSKNGVWSLFHMLDDLSKGAGRVSFYGGGHDLRYQFTAASAADPLNPALLREFHCPSGI
jgi:type VI secretion system protein ImpL